MVCTEPEYCKFAEQVNQYSSCCTKRCMGIVLSQDIAKLLSYYDVCWYEKTRLNINNNNRTHSAKLNLTFLTNPTNEIGAVMSRQSNLPSISPDRSHHCYLKKSSLWSMPDDSLNEHCHKWQLLDRKTTTTYPLKKCSHEQQLLDWETNTVLSCKQHHLLTGTRKSCQ